MDYLNGTQITVPVILHTAGEPFIPDVGSVKFSVYDHAGQPIAGLTDILVVTTSTTVTVEVVVPAADNQITVGRKFEKRTIVVTATRNGRFHRQVETYRITPFLNHSVSPSAVRGFLGVQEKELPDGDIDILSAYLFVEKDFGDSNLMSALSSGTTQELAANECIRLRAVLEVIPSMKQRVAQSEANGPISFERPTLVDFHEVERNAQDRYYSAKMEALGTVEATNTYVITTTDADPITG